MFCLHFNNLERGVRKFLMVWALGISTKPANDLSIVPTKIFHPVAFMGQQYPNMCADACVKMLYNYRGIDKDNRMISLNFNPRGMFKDKGSSSFKFIVGSSRSTQLNNESQWLSALSKLGPIICVLKLSDSISHSILAIGLTTSGDIIYHDPWAGPDQIISIQELYESGMFCWRYFDYLKGYRSISRDPFKDSCHTFLVDP